MPDIGLLQGGPRPARATSTPEPRPEPPAHAAGSAEAAAVAAPYIAPVDSAITLAAPVVSAAEPSSAPVSTIESPDGPSATSVARVLGGPPPIRSRDLLWLVLALLVLIGTGIGVRDPWPADEPRFAAVARDMVVNHEWLFPRVGGDLYQDKPPLFFWLLAACYAVIGSIRWSFVLPAFFAAGGVMLLIYDLGRRLATREAGVAAALLTVSTLHFVLTMRGAQIDPVLCLLSTFSLYALLRHLLLGPAWGWYALGGFAAGLGVITKGVGFLPVLVIIPFFLMRRFGWSGLAPIDDAGRGGWRWWLAPLAMLGGICLWFVPMLIAVQLSGAPEYVAYRDEILFKQTVGRYAAAWHHVKPFWYFIVEVIPLLWLPWSLLLFWLVPRFRAAFTNKDAGVWLPLAWALIALLFFSASPGKRGVYILPALPALAIASLPFLDTLLARPGVRRAGFILAGFFWMLAAVLLVGVAFGLLGRHGDEIESFPNVAAILAVYVLVCGAGLIYAWRRAPLAAWPVALGALALVFSYAIAPVMNGERSGKEFTAVMLERVMAEEELALVAYKEQFLLYLDRPVVNFGHRRWLEGPQEAYDAAAWLNAGPLRVLLVPEDNLKPCFPSGAIKAGRSSSEDWYLVRAPAAEECAAKGNAQRAIHYAQKPR